MLTAAASATTPDAAAEDPPSADLLLYLGEFEDANGEFVDPMSLEQDSVPPAADDANSTATAPEDEDGDESAPRSD